MITKRRPTTRSKSDISGSIERRVWIELSANGAVSLARPGRHDGNPLSSICLTLEAPNHGTMAETTQSGGQEALQEADRSVPKGRSQLELFVELRHLDPGVL